MARVIVRMGPGSCIPDLCLIKEDNLLDADKVRLPLPMLGLQEASKDKARVRDFRINSASGARHRCRQPKWQALGLSTEDQLVGYREIDPLMTACNWYAGGKLGLG